ncbi:hypothetical protein E2562_033798 [Oryza meyeriana var. granulata]|uniref:Uncharacterized protein n=1 Tax=Oryza meyeriana var. granulata TaxID=110450 RepID=A0A6G1C2B9_9ORYZ|nr:hypothetical protein E2562_033798 [Oryza meyeriana var. granulata]
MDGDEGMVDVAGGVGGGDCEATRWMWMKTRIWRRAGWIGARRGGWRRWGVRTTGCTTAGGVASGDTTKAGRDVELTFRLFRVGLYTEKGI